MIPLCVLGPSGRMGAQVATLALASSELRLCSAADRAGSAIVGSRIAGSDVVVGDDLQGALSQAKVYIDFTTPASTASAARIAAKQGCAAVVGTTGLDAEAESALDELARVAPVLVAANFSPGVALLLHLAELAARALGPAYDLEVLELHHRNKVDAPSGTALALGKALAKGRDLDFQAALQSARTGQVGPRKDNEIGMFAIRGGDIIGEHTAFLIGAEERIEISHKAQRRSVFASGALRAASWLAERAPGRYTMTDLLGF